MSTDNNNIERIELGDLSIEEYLEQRTSKYWVVCNTNGCRLNNVLLENVDFVDINGFSITCGPCSTKITDLGPMETVEERKSRSI
jgi:hypothetical protein